MIKPISTAKPGNDENSLSYLNFVKDFSRHKFIETYLRGDVIGPKIVSAIENNFGNMVAPDDCDSPPEVTLSATPTSGVAPLTVTATAVATDDGEIVDYTFDFSDGAPKSGKQSTAPTRV